MILPVSAVKYVAVPVAVMSVFDWKMSGGIAFGMISGWFLSAATLLGRPESKRLVMAQFITSIMAAGVGILVILWTVRFAGLDPLGAATVAAAVGFAGAKGAARIMARTFDQIMGDRANEAQKQIAAIRAALKDSEKERGDE